MMKPLKLKSLTEKPLSWFDWIAFAVLAGFCFISFNQAGDILHTGGSSFAYLNGHILDFYDYNIKFVGGNAYMPSSYILFAIWNIPLRVFRIVVEPTMTGSLKVLSWYKLLPTLFYFASGFLMYKIALELKMGQAKAKLCAYAFLAMPVGFFSQFIFGQYDSFTVFFVLLGLLFYFRRQLLPCAIIFGISITFKYFSLVVFIPLLLLYEKRIWHIVKYLAIAAIPMAAEILLYAPSAGFRSGVFGFGATGYIFLTSFSTIYFSLSIFIVAWIVLAAAAYFTNVDGDVSLAKWAIFYLNFTVFLIFGLSMWHPQWLLFAVPFWVLGAFMNKKFDIFMIIQFLIMVFYILFTVNFWTDYIDQNMLAWGIFGDLLGGRIDTNLSVRAIYKIQDRNMFYSIMSGLLLVSAIFKHPKYSLDDFSEPIDRSKWGWTRFQFWGGMGFFLLPCAACFVVALHSPFLQCNTGVTATDNVGMITQDNCVSQVFTAQGEEVTEIKVYVGTCARVNLSDITLSIIDASTNEVIEEMSVKVDLFTDNAMNTIDIEDVQTTVGAQYILQFSSLSTNQDDAITIYRTADDTANPACYAINNGVNESYNLCIAIYGSRPV